MPLSQNTEFKSVRNMVIAEAMNILMQKEMDDFPDEPEATEDDFVSEELHDAECEATPKEKISAMWKLYLQAKALLDRDSESYDPNRAVALLIDAANMGCGVAKYRLGKMFLRGDEVAKNVDYALRWLEESVAEQNPYRDRFQFSLFDPFFYQILRQDGDSVPGHSTSDQRLITCRFYHRCDGKIVDRKRSVKQIP